MAGGTVRASDTTSGQGGGRAGTHLHLRRHQAKPAAGRARRGALLKPPAPEERGRPGQKGSQPY